MSVVFGIFCLAWFTVCLALAVRAYTQIGGGHGAQGDPATGRTPFRLCETPSFVFTWDEQS